MGRMGPPAERTGRKPLQTRLMEAMNIYKGIQDSTGMSPAAHPALREFREAADRFVRTGRAESGEFRIHGTDRSLVYELSGNPRKESGVTLRKH